MKLSDEVGREIMHLLDCVDEVLILRGVGSENLRQRIDMAWHSLNVAMYPAGTPIDDKIKAAFP